jgi:DNA-binding GntR family transcriptional regulator
MIGASKFLFVLAGRSRGQVVTERTISSFMAMDSPLWSKLGGAGRYVGSKARRACAVSAKCEMTAGSGGSGGQAPSPGDSPPPGRAAAAQGGGGARKLIAVDAQVPPQRAASSVLADRIAAALVHREPGWRLPRRSALARRYGVGIAEIDTAIAELSRRSLIRRLPDGQLYRASPAEYLIPVEGVGRLSTRLDPMGGEIACQSRHVSQRGAPQDVAWALGIDGDAPVRIIRCVWTVDTEPVAISTAYVPEAVADSLAGPDEASFEAMLHSIPALTPDAEPAYAKALDLEMSPPQPSVARSLRLVPGQSAISVTIRFDDHASSAPVGLTVVIMKPDQFRVVIEAGRPPHPRPGRA